MIKRLRRRFTLMTMGALVAVFVILLAAINVTNLISVNRETDGLLRLITEYGGRFPSAVKPDEGRPQRPGMSAETPYETRYFSVVLDAAGAPVSANTDSIAAVNANDAMAYAEKALARGGRSGRIENYRYLISDNANGKLAVFVDVSRQTRAAQTFLSSSLLAAAGMCGIVFFIVFLVSGRAIKPLAESYQKQRQFITDAGHELKTPLTIIDANTEVLELEYGENEWTQSSKKQVARLSHLVRELISLSRMDEQSHAADAAVFDLSAAVAEAAEPFFTLAKTKGKTLVAAVEPDITYNGNEQSLRRLLGILLDNAVKFAREGGEITLTLRRAGRAVLLECRNPADGFTKGAHDELFERFYRADAARGGETGGYGIGLAVAQSIVLAHKGRITARSPDGDSLVITAAL